MITGKKVMLREKGLEDAWNDYRWKSDAELANLDATFPLDIPFSVYLASYSDELHYPDSRSYRYAIETLEGKHIGNCSCYNVDYRSGEAELGILIGDPKYWAKGYGSDAVTTLVNYVFRKDHLKKIYLHTLEENIRAQKCFQKCGFVARGRVIRGIYKFVLMEIKKEKIFSNNEPD